MITLDIGDIVLGAPLVGVGISFGFVVVKWTANFIVGRLDKREARVEAGATQIHEWLTEEVKRLSDECVALRERATTAEEQHAECRKEVMELRGLIQGRGDARNDVARIVAADRVADKRKPKDAE